MNILYVTYDMPFPADTGGKLRAYHLLKRIAKKHSVTLISFFRKKDQIRYKEELMRYCADCHFFPRRPVTSLSTIQYLPLMPFPAALYYSTPVSDFIKKIIVQNSIDLVHLESFYASSYIRDIHSVPVILGTENIEWRIYDEYAQSKPSFVRELLKFEVRRIKKFEEFTWQKAQTCLAVSEENALEIQKNTISSCTIVPNGIDSTEFKNPSKIYSHKEITLLFVGSMDYIQNKDAAMWMINSIWPKIRARLVSSKKLVRLVLVGSGTEMLRRVISDDTIDCIGKVSDIKKIYQNADILVAPIRIGSGTKFKILEGAAAGLSVVTTKNGCAGLLDMRAGTDILVAHSEDEFIKHCLDVIHHDAKGKRIAQSGRKKVLDNYSWDSIVKVLLRTYDETVNNYRQL